LKVLFSGDTRPCESVIRAGKDVDLLIHEATMGDDLQDEAIAKRHSTISEAIEVGRKMAAKHVLLTHFSQRYAKCAPPIPKDAHNVAVAFDLMQIPLSRFHEIEGWAYNQQLRAVLPEDSPSED
jgi:ribonuclease Z